MMVMDQPIPHSCSHFMLDNLKWLQVHKLRALLQTLESNITTYYVRSMELLTDCDISVRQTEGIVGDK